MDNMGPLCPSCGKCKIPLDIRFLNYEYELFCPCGTVYNDEGKKVIYSKNGDRKVVD